MTKGRLIKMFIKVCKQRHVPEQPKFYVCTLHKIYNDNDWIKVAPNSIEYFNDGGTVAYKLTSKEFNKLKECF
jgi:hypothetical protein